MRARNPRQSEVSSRSATIAAARAIGPRRGFRRLRCAARPSIRAEPNDGEETEDGHRPSEDRRHDGRSRERTFREGVDETKLSFKTTELLAYVATVRASSSLPLSTIRSMRDLLGFSRRVWRLATWSAEDWRSLEARITRAGTRSRAGTTGGQAVHPRSGEAPVPRVTAGGRPRRRRADFPGVAPGVARRGQTRHLRSRPSKAL
jgi:hypothetical protein